MLQRFLPLFVVPLTLVGACSGSSAAPSTMDESTSTSTAVTSTTTSPTTTIAPTTVAPTTTLATPTVESVFLVMPGAADLPPGWTTVGGMPSAGLTPAQGPGIGICGGANLDMRAQAAGVLVAMSSPSMQTADGGMVGFLVYAFADDESAAELMRSTSSQVQCPGYEYTLVEGTGPDHYDGFGGKFGDGKAKWTIREAVTVGAVDVPDTVGSFHVKTEVEYLTAYQGTSYGFRETTINVYEQHGRFVFIASLTGQCCAYGFSNAATTAAYTPTLEALTAGLDVIRPHVLERLADAKLL